MRQKCRDPCPGSCGADAICNVINHTPICTCPERYTGDPFSYCTLKTEPSKFIPRKVSTYLSKIVLSVEPVIVDKCNPSPCGPNTLCRDGICSCLSEYQGDPYRGCRPECVLNDDCPRNRACIRNKCEDPCPGTCGQNAECSVINHIPMCTCFSGYQGNAFIACNPQPGKSTFKIFQDNILLRFNFSSTTKSLHTITLWTKQSM